MWEGQRLRSAVLSHQQLSTEALHGTISAFHYVVQYYPARRRKNDFTLLRWGIKLIWFLLCITPDLLYRHLWSEQNQIKMMMLNLCFMFLPSRGIFLFLKKFFYSSKQIELLQEANDSLEPPQIWSHHIVTWQKMAKFSENAISQSSLFIVCLRMHTHTGVIWVMITRPMNECLRRGLNPQV